MSKSAPEAPDYTKAAEAQAQSSREVTEQQTWANRPTINTPWGSQSWDVNKTWDPATKQYLNQWTQNTDLNPRSQQALDSQMDITQGRSDLALDKMGQVQDEYGKPMDWNKFQHLQGAGNPTAGLQTNLSTRGLTDVDPSQRYSERAENAVYDKFSQRMDPQFQKEQDRMRTQLYNSGLKEGDAAYDQQMKELNQTQGDQRQDAMNQSILTGGQEASRFFGMDQSSRQQGFNERQAAMTMGNQAVGQRFDQRNTAANQNNTLRQQQISEEMQKRGFSLNEMNAILSGQQVGMPSMPGFNQAQRSDATQYSQAAGQQYQASMDAFNAQNQQMQGLMQGGMGAAMMFSDRDLKRDIRKIGTDINGNALYIYKLVGEDELRIGVMADEVDQKFVAQHPSGYKMVDYGAMYG